MLVHLGAPCLHGFGAKTRGPAVPTMLHLTLGVGGQGVLEGIAELQHGSASADKLAAAGEAALDDCKELAARFEDVGLLGILHGLPGLLLHQAVHGLPQLLLLSIHIHSAGNSGRPYCTQFTCSFIPYGLLEHVPASDMLNSVNFNRREGATNMRSEGRDSG